MVYSTTERQVERETYRIGTDVLPDGRVKAQARGRKTNRRTFPIGTAPEQAAESMARKFEGENFASVRMASTNGLDKSDWKVFVYES